MTTMTMAASMLILALVLSLSSMSAYGWGMVSRSSSSSCKLRSDGAVTSNLRSYYPPSSSILTPSSPTILSLSSGIIQEEEEEEEVKEEEEKLSTIPSSSAPSSSQRQQQPSRRNKQNPPTIITCSSTKELLRAVNSVLTTQNQRQQGQEQEQEEPYIVAELGSQLRDVSNCILEYGSAKSILVDIKRDYPKNPTTPATEPRISAMRVSDNNSNKQFHEIDNLSDWRNAFFPSSSSSSSSSSLNVNNNNVNKNYDVLVLDVNAIVGNDLEFTALDIILEFEQMCKMAQMQMQQNSGKGLQYIIVKSMGLNTVSNQLTYTKPWIDLHTINANANANANKNNRDNDKSNQLCRIVATVGVNEYRQTIPGVLCLLEERSEKSSPPSPSPLTSSLTEDNDNNKNNKNNTNDFFVIEVGCHFGTTTVLLNNVFHHTMGIDVGSKIIKEANKKYPDVYFKAGDAWKTAELLRLQQEYYNEYNIENNNENDNNKINRKIGFDAVYIDVGGLSSTNGLLDTISLIKSIQYSLEPECIVIKSLCLNKLATRIIPYWKWSKEKRKQLESRDDTVTTEQD
jgi:hypothetical protein